MLSAFAALALLALSAQDGPVATSPNAPRQQPTAVPGVAFEPPVPQGAPSDDYGLVAWCQGALRGHLDLAEMIKDSLPLDADQQALGAEYLKVYDEALAAAPQSKTADGAARAVQEKDNGYRRWNAARAATDRQTQAYTYLGWQLPGRCDVAAKRLTDNGALLGAALATPAPATQP